MAEPWQGVAQEQAQASSDAALANAWALLTTEFWTVVALTVAAMAFGIALLGVIREWIDEPDDDSPKWVWTKHKKRLKRLGLASSFVWAPAAHASAPASKAFLMS